MKISLTKAWEELSIEFNLDSHHHWYALAIIVRYSLEKENLMEKVPSSHLPIIHNLLHHNSAKSEIPTIARAISHCLLLIKNKYKISAILKKLISLIQKNNKDFFKIHKFISKITKNYKLKITTFSVFIYKPLIYIYTGKKWNDKDEKWRDETITFISWRKLNLDESYLINFKYAEINNHTKIFYLLNIINQTEKVKKEIRNKYQIRNGKELFKLLSNSKWYLAKNNIRKREIFADITSYYANPFKKISKLSSFLPFLERPLICKTPCGLKMRYAKEILKHCDQQDKWIKQYNLKKS